MKCEQIYSQIGEYQEEKKKKKKKEEKLEKMRKIFQIASYSRSLGKKLCCETSYYQRRKNPYDVLIVMPKWSIFCYHLRSFVIGLWILLKWLFQFLWHSLNQSSYQQKQIQTSLDYPAYLYDKPPPCLVDNRIGLQSYVKLKVSLLACLHGIPIIFIY